VASLLDWLNIGLNGDSRSSHVGLRQVKEENMSDFIRGKDWSPSYLFISRSCILSRLMFRFPGYKYQRPDYCKDICNKKIQYLFAYGQ